MGPAGGSRSGRSAPARGPARTEVRRSEVRRVDSYLTDVSRSWMGRVSARDDFALSAGSVRFCGRFGARPSYPRGPGVPPWSCVGCFASRSIGGFSAHSQVTICSFTHSL